MRMVSLGVDNVHAIGDLMDEELETHHEEQERVVGALQSVADATPALGIVAAVLGVIKTMGSISEPPEVLGYLIGGALVGTFFGVFVAYGFFGPMAQSLRIIFRGGSQVLSVAQGGAPGPYRRPAARHGGGIRAQGLAERGSPHLRRSRSGDLQSARHHLTRSPADTKMAKPDQPIIIKKVKKADHGHHGGGVRKIALCGLS